VNNPPPPLFSLVLLRLARKSTARSQGKLRCILCYDFHFIWRGRKAVMRGWRRILLFLEGQMRVISARGYKQTLI